MLQVRVHVPAAPNDGGLSLGQVRSPQPSVQPHLGGVPVCICVHGWIHVPVLRRVS